MSSYLIFLDPQELMIRCVLIINDHGKARLVRFYDSTNFQKQQMILQTVHRLVSSRTDPTSCCFIDNVPSEIRESDDEKIIYRHFASLYFVVIADSCESELGILDLLQVFVHVLDSCFENICELDIVYHYDRVNYVLDEIIMGGMVLETSSEIILNSITEINKYSKTLA
jgi:AP-3 complex subunit sigma